MAESVEQIALLLMNEIIKAENPPVRDRDYILTTYAECLFAVKHGFVQERTSDTPAPPDDGKVIPLHGA